MAKIYGTVGKPLRYCSYNFNQGLPNDGCDTLEGASRRCTITGSDIESLKLTGDNSFLYSNDDRVIGGCTSGTDIVIGEDNYPELGSISLYGNCNATIFNANKEFKVKHVEIGSNATLTLNEGDYFFERLVLNSNANVFTKGHVRIFTKEPLEVTSAKIVNDNFSKLTLLSYSSIYINGNSYVHGNLYSDGDINLNGSSVIHGKVTSRYLSMFDKSVIGNKETTTLKFFKVSFKSGALSCVAKPIMIEACANDNCSDLLPDPASITLTKNGSNYTSATFDGSTSLDVWHPQGGLVTLGLGNTTPSGEYRCYIDGSLVANSQCQLNFEDSGIYFDIDDSTSCKNSTNFELFAVKKDQNSQQCVPLFANQTKPLAMAFNYITPNASGITNAEKLTVNSLNSPQASVEISGGATEQLQVRFDANGKALLNVNYPEAGRVELEATLTEEISSPDGSTSETLVLSHSEQFVAKPDGFHFFNPSTANGCTGASCAKFAKAGDDFAMSVKAVCGVDDATPFKDRPALGNFRFSDLNIKAVLQAPLISNGDPEDGGLGGIGQSKLSFTKANSAPFNMGDQTYSEVGAISFALDGDVNYLGTTIAEANASSDIFGRFTPYFLSIEANTPKLQAQCNSFTYMDQPFGFQSGMEPTIAVKGMSKSGAETNNYQIGDWWRYHGNQWTDRSYSDTSGATSVDGAALAVQDVSPLSEQVDYYPTDQANTIQRAYLSGTQLSYPRTESLAVPFNASFDLVLNNADVTDSDGICHQDAAALTAGCKGFTFKDVAKDDAFAMRYGRMLLQNAYGPSSEELRLEVNTQYVDDNATWA
nr:DUF6701 domain-containing protein [Shewanella halifaxensis]